MTQNTKNQIRNYQIAVVCSLLFAFLGFSYNVWRLEVTETNTNIRTACFEMLLVLSELEQLVYSAHYDKNTIEGSPRKGWVKVGLITDLGTLTSSDVDQSTIELKEIWSKNWVVMSGDQEATNTIINAIDSTRVQIKMLLLNLK